MKDTDSDLYEVHQQARIEFDQIQSALYQERMNCMQDRRFCSLIGAQWEGPLGNQFENKPRFEVNKVHMAVQRIINEYRNNRIGVNFVSREGEEEDKLAETCAGLYRADEQSSGAEEAYDNAFEEAVMGGFGAWRLRTEYSDDENPEDDRQHVCIEPIFDADTSVYFDLGAKRQDKADAKRCFVLTSMTYAAYKAEWNDDPSTWPKTITRSQFDWYTPSVVYVCEYYKIEEVSEQVRTYQSIDGKEETLWPDQIELKEEGMLAIGWKEVRRKKVKTKKVHKYIMSGNKILEDCGYIAGKCIPIIPVYGKRWFVDNVERCMGHVRLAKDAQRLKNMQLSKLGEIAALSAMEKPILLPEQVAGHQLMWAEDNLKNYPYLLINPITDANGNPAPGGPVAYTKPPSIPPSMAALLQITEADMQEILGSPQQGDKMVSHLSGKTVELIQQRLDMQTFVYMSNMSKAVKRCGEVWLSIARDIFIEQGRKMKSVTSSGKMQPVELMKPVVNDEGEIEYENDLSDADYDVEVLVGPSSQTKRQATVRALTDMMTLTQDPEMTQVLSAMAMLNMEGEGISDVRDYFRHKLLKMGVLKPTEAEAQQLAQEAQNAAPDPQAEYLKAASEQAIAQAAKAQADSILSVAKAEETRAKTTETLSKVSMADQERIFALADRLTQPAPQMQ
jgi:hypothetical protein